MMMVPSILKNKNRPVSGTRTHPNEDEHDPGACHKQNYPILSLYPDYLLLISINPLVDFSRMRDMYP